MQSPDTHDDAPLVPYTPDRTEAESTTRTDGGPRTAVSDFDRPPRTDYASEYTRDAEEIEPFVADLR
jgi:hypothetical protein